MEDISSWASKFEPCHYSDRLIGRLILFNKAVASHSVDIQEIKKAIYYAKKYHGDQKRQSGELFYSHPLEVTYMFAEYVANENQKCFRTDLLVTAILHDTIEDTELTFENIKAIFGKTVADNVMNLTKIKEDGRKISPDEMLNSLWLQGKNDLMLIKLMDRLHNMQTIQIKSEEKIKKTINETLGSFMVFAMHTQSKELEEALYYLCCKALAIQHDTYEPTQVTRQDTSHLVFSEGTETDRFVSQVFQNITTPIEK